MYPTKISALRLSTVVATACFAMSACNEPNTFDLFANGIRNPDIHSDCGTDVVEPPPPPPPDASVVDAGVEDAPDDNAVMVDIKIHDIVKDSAPQVVFTASCGGVLDCPQTGPCATWTYDVLDDGSSSNASASLVVTIGDGDSCNAVSSGDSLPTGEVTDKVVFDCFNVTWTFGINRQSMLVYIHASPSEPGPGWDWTPSCN